MKRFTFLLIAVLLVVSVVSLSACQTKVEREVLVDDTSTPPPATREVKNETETQKPASVAEVKPETEPAPETVETVEKIETKPISKPVEIITKNTNIPYFASVTNAERIGNSTKLSWKNGSKTQDFSSYGGKIYLIDVWAQWCAPCKMSTSSLIDLHNKYADKGLVVIGINIDKASAVPVAKEYAEDVSIPYVILEDPQGAMVGGKFVQQGIPNFTLVDSNGNIIKEHTGALTNGSPALNEIENIIRSQIGD